MDGALARRLSERVIGIDRRRRLPRFARRTLARQASAADGTAEVLLFTDTFTNHYDPHVGLAAVNVLAAAGVRAGLAGNRCCGRPQISKGLLGDARALAERNV